MRAALSFCLDYLLYRDEGEVAAPVRRKASALRLCLAAIVLLNPLIVHSLNLYRSCVRVQFVPDRNFIAPLLQCQSVILIVAVCYGNHANFIIAGF